MSGPVWEVWERVERTDGGESGYRWMLWFVGPIDCEKAEWFATREEAFARLAELRETGQ